MELVFIIILAVVIVGEAVAIWYLIQNSKKKNVSDTDQQAAEENARQKLAETETLMAAKNAELARIESETKKVQSQWEEANKKLIAVQKDTTSSLEQKNAALEEEKRAHEELVRCQGQVKILQDNKALLLTDIAAQKAKMAELIENHRQMEMREAEKDLEHGEVLPLEVWEKDELNELEGIARKLRNPAPLYKALYEIYYAAALKKLIADTGASDKTGIYRLWVLVSPQEITSNAPAGTDGSSDVGLQLVKNPVRVLNYVGQAVNIGDRWAQHIKRGLGLDTVGTSVQLYPAMKKYGIENFHFEVLEICDKDELSERETYWGNYYAVKEVGLNKKLG
jgi:hypothetical protein